MLRKTVVKSGQHLTKSIEEFQLTTTVDITATGQYDDQSQQNWDALVTVIGMRAQPVVLAEPEAVADLSTIDDTYVVGTAGYVFRFTTEHVGVFSEHDKNYEVTDEVGVLSDMLDGITLGGTTMVFGDNINVELMKSYE